MKVGWAAVSAVEIRPMGSILCSANLVGTFEIPVEMILSLPKPTTWILSKAL